MRDRFVNNLLYWLGVGFIVGCLSAAVPECVRADATLDCLDPPPACDYGRAAMCVCDENNEKCRWLCVAVPDRFE